MGSGTLVVDSLARWLVGAWYRIECEQQPGCGQARCDCYSADQNLVNHWRGINRAWFRWLAQSATLNTLAFALGVTFGNCHVFLDLCMDLGHSLLGPVSYTHLTLPTKRI